MDIETLTNKVWIDGKPIYRKVLNIGAKKLVVGDNIFAHDVGDIETIVNIDYMFYYSNNSRWYTFSDVIATKMCSSKKVFLYLKTELQTTDLKIIIEYTKTTD